MSKVLLVLLLVPLFWGQWSIAIYAKPKINRDVYINLYVREAEEYENFNIPSNGVKFTLDLSKKGWNPCYIMIFVKGNVDLRSIVNKIYTDGYIWFGYSVKLKAFSYVYILSQPGSTSIFIKSRDGAAFQADLRVFYIYERLLKTTYNVSSKDSSTRILEFNIPFNEIKGDFPKIDSLRISICWKGGCELVSLKNPDNINVLNIPNKVEDRIIWGWNHLLINVFKLVEKGMNADGKWVLTFREFDPDTPPLYQYPDIAVFLYDEIYKYNAIDLPPGLEITVKIEDYMPKDLPKTWHLCKVGVRRTFYIRVDKGNIDDLEVKETFLRRYTNYMYCYPYKRSFVLRNRGSSTLKLGLSAYIGIATQLVSKTTYDGNLVTVKFKVPSPRDLPLYAPGEERWLDIYLYHPGFWGQINLYTPYNRSAQEHIEVYSDRLSTLFTLYGGNNVYASIYTGKKPFEGWWTYKAYVPMVLVDDPLGIVDLKPPSLTGKIFRKDDRVWAHYSLGEKVYINVTEKVVENGSTRYIFKNWIGNYYNGSDTFIEKIFGRAELVQERYSYDVEYYLKVVSEYGSVSGEGWYLKDSQATISVSPIETGFLVKRVFDYWSVDGQTYTASTVTLTVNKPLTAVAHWREDYTMLYIIVGVVAVIMILIVVMVKRRKKEEYPPIPPPPPPPPPK